MRTVQKPKNKKEQIKMLTTTVTEFSRLEKLHNQTIFTPGFFTKYVTKQGCYSYSKCFTACKLTASSATEALTKPSEFLNNYEQLTESYKPRQIIQKPSENQIKMDIEEKYTIQEWNEKFKEMNIEQKDNQIKFTFKEIVEISKMIGVELTQTIIKKITL